MSRDWSKVKEICDKATPGPWGISMGSGINLCTWVRYENPETGAITFVADCLPDNALDVAEKDHVPNMEFITTARTALPEAIAEIEQLQIMRLGQDAIAKKQFELIEQLRQDKAELVEGLKSAFNLMSSLNPEINILPAKVILAKHERSDSE